MNHINHLCLLLLVALVACGRPIANFTISADDTIAPAEIQFDNSSEKAETYEWDFGDGNSSKETSPSHRYRSSGNYEVVLRATNAKNKSRETTKRLVIDAPEQCLVEIETPFGNMLAVLYDVTPQHQDNFTKLADEGYFDEMLFHRVIDGFMIQGGDPDSKNARPGQPLGGGGPGYQIPAEFVDTLVHIKGALAAARTGDRVNPQKESSGSQFYIVHGKPQSENSLTRVEAQRGVYYTKDQKEAYLEKGGAPFLDGNYTVFGQVISGLDIIDKITDVKTDGRDRPVEDVKMKIRLIR